jgi:hypothetical protein
VELLWYGFVAAYVLGILMVFGWVARTPWCPHCRLQAITLAHQIGDTFPPVFEVIYRYPRCRTIVWRRFVNTSSE